MKAWQAYGPAGRVTSTDDPQAAQRLFFATFPKARKCNIVEGDVDGSFFTVTYGRYSAGEWPRNWKDVTKNTLLETDQ